VVEITLYSMRSCTFSQCSDWKIWSRLEESGCVEGDLTVFEEDSIKIKPAQLGLSVLYSKCNSSYHFNVKRSKVKIAGLKVRARNGT